MTKMKSSLLALLLAVCSLTTARADALKYSLGLFESGANTFAISTADYKRGGSGEVSRYQIMPDVWKEYSSSSAYRNPDVAWRVAEKVLNERVAYFVRRVGRNPDATELYLLWNKPGHFEAAGFKLARVSAHYRNRAQRFANLYYAVEKSYEDLYQKRDQEMAMAQTTGDARS